MPEDLLSRGESRLLPVNVLLKHEFFIPKFQRPYDWDKEQVDDFIGDVKESQSRGLSLFLGMIVLHGLDTGGYAIVDGQQRLTTLMLAIAASGDPAKVLSEAGPLRRLWITPRQADASFVKSLIKGNKEPQSTLSHWLIDSAFQQLRQADLPVSALLKCEVISYVAPSLAGATGLFERINLRGKRVSEFDLVKNKLIEWASVERDERSRTELEQFISTRYDVLYTTLDPKATESAFDSDKLLRIHWILFSEVQFSSGEKVLKKLDAALDAVHRAGGKIGTWIERYLDSLVRVTSVWVWVERPYGTHRPQISNGLRNAVLDFAKLRREGEHQPLIVAAILRFGNRAETLVRFCEINSFRAALAKKYGNHGRSVKWRLARQLHQETLIDGVGSPIDSVEGVVHQLFWLSTPYWSKEEAADFDDKFSPEEIASQVIPEDALDNPNFLSQYRGLVHYFFWKYGSYLLSSPEWADQVKVDLNPFQEATWFEAGDNNFLKWDIEHIYPRNPHDRQTREGRDFMKSMELWLNHLGNLTVLPIGDNRGMGNAVFSEKIKWMSAQHKVSFNELLHNRAYTGRLMNTPYWGPHNCGKRVKQIKSFAGEMWGTEVITRLGVGEHDERIKGYDIDMEELESEEPDAS